MLKAVSRLYGKVTLYAHTMQRRMDTLAVIERERYVKELLSDAKYQNTKRLEPFGFKVYSQYDEDGIIQEIFKRVGLKSKIFVEFGVQDGMESNSHKLLLEGWSGLWIEGDERYVLQITQKFRDIVADGRLRVKGAFIDRNNINGLIGAHFTGEIDFLSIDIDGNDLYVLDSISIVNARVIVVEYNGKFPPPMNVAQRYDPDFRWDLTDYWGASLEAITKIGTRKGYSLVGCGIAGINAFFVRNDLVGDKFEAPFTAENHFQPIRNFLWRTYPSGHPPSWGPYESI